MKNLSLNGKILLVMSSVALVVSIAFAAYLYVTVAQTVDRSTGFGIIAFVVIGYMLSIGAIYFFISYSVVGPIRFVTEGARRLSTGDIALAGMDRNRVSAINARPDELGDIGKAFTNLIENQSSKLTAIQSS